MPLVEMSLFRPLPTHLYYMQMLVPTALRGLNWEPSEYILIFVYLNVWIY